MSEHGFVDQFLSEKVLESHTVQGWVSGVGVFLQRLRFTQSLVSGFGRWSLNASSQGVCLSIFVAPPLQLSKRC